MFVLLPPSETKAPGGQGAPLQLTRLSFPSLGPIRSRVIAAVQAASTDVDLARTVLRLSARQDAELAANRALWHSATTPALLRYTGVLYEALDYPSLPAADRQRAQERLVVASALFGAVRAGDEIPAYRLSAGIRLPGLGSLRSVWRPALTAALAGGPVLDLRSSMYQALGPLPDAITVRVVSPDRTAGWRPSATTTRRTRGGSPGRCAPPSGWTASRTSSSPRRPPTWT
ncbi:hypothetical protein Athai_26560 [Actinocatenispora thailandica]|uniref:Peroxide stress protein YaaA n=1 Tax=Actinocatenispora thailandica TaxID=227318 RepID=A0A7R7HXH5_9ACTN|nr:peroxide stress protein YaaA [Actinocatenispora thailandica]BCJ35153.1 hypothetical protein Athai_26560 [Actinocatenispora thailandica]